MFKSKEKEKDENKFIAQIKREEILIGKKLGEGAFGVVYEAQCRGSKVAIKIPKKENLTIEEKELFTKEINKMSQLRHENICEYYGSVIANEVCMIVTEKLVGDVETRAFDSNNPLPFLQRLYWAKQAAQGMAWLHGNSVIHFDFKLSNLLFDENGVVKICDLGLSMHDQERKTTKPSNRGTPVFMAPEVMKAKKKPTIKVDVYSYGLSLWELFCSRQCFTEFNNIQTFFTEIINGYRPDLNIILQNFKSPTHVPSDLLRLITDCWQSKVSKRPSFEEIVNRLNNIILEAAIPDNNLRQFWQTHFNFQSDVKWEQFLQALSKQFGIYIPELYLTNSIDSNSLLAHGQTNEQLMNQPFNQILEYASRSIENFKQVYSLKIKIERLDQILTLVRLQTIFAQIDSLNRMMVNMEKFGKIAAFFRPLSLTQIQELCYCVDQPWFHPDITTKQISDIRLGNNPNYFLIRFSSSLPATFVLACQNSQYQITRSAIGKILFPIKDANGKSSFETYNSLMDLIAHKSNCITGAPGSQLAAITDLAVNNYSFTN
eukprot:TRINITY_DN689_c0_g4_i1.p1 TRINITY_DN689_c0_g4~~TRINITY_DN689_c0_g4_i1.p1  ORF type:complete len:545 (-),score=233.18 TRINITY_DN689_c0_g4_i1:14-1648(-)